MALATQEKWSVTLTVDGTTFDVWDSFEGGEVRAESSVYHAGGMAAPTSEVGPPEVSEITLSRAWDPVRDSLAERKLVHLIGRDAVVGKQALDRSGTPIAGALTTYRGRLTGVSTPEHDSMGRDVNRFQVTVVAEGLPS